MSMLRSSFVFLLVLVAAGCSRQTSTETAAGSEVVKWTVEGVDAPKPFSANVSSAKGTSYTVNASVGTQQGKRVASNVTVQVKDNPTKAEISGACRPALNYAGDPPDVLTTTCPILETIGKAELTGKSTQTVASVIKVKGDGSIALAAE